jgi:MFS family permease
VRNALAGLISAGVGYLGGRYFVEQNVLGNGYATTFLLAFVLTEIGLLMLLFLREPDSPDVRERSGVAARLAQLPAMLRADPNFGAFLATCVIGSLGRMAMPYYVLHAQREASIGGSELGLLTAGFLLASMGVNIFWGWIADRYGFRAVCLGGLGMWVAGTLALIASHSMLSLIGVFMALGAGSGGFQMGYNNMVLEFGHRQDLPLRIGAASSASEAMGVLAPPLGGFLAAQFSYATVFWCAIGFKLAAAAVVLLWLQDPRAARGITPR